MLSVGRLCSSSTATLVVVTLLSVMLVTLSLTSKGLEPFWLRRPRTTVQSDATGGLEGKRTSQI